MGVSANRKLRDQGLKRFEVDLVLTYSQQIRQHYCMFCRYGLFKSQFRAISLDPSLGDETMPATQVVSIQCPDCGTIYRIGINQ